MCVLDHRVLNVKVHLYVIHTKQCCVLCCICKQDIKRIENHVCELKLKSICIRRLFIIYITSLIKVIKRLNRVIDSVW